MVLGAIGTIGKCQHLTYATGLVGVAYLCHWTCWGCLLPEDFPLSNLMVSLSPVLCSHWGHAWHPLKPRFQPSAPKMEMHQWWESLHSKGRPLGRVLCKTQPIKVNADTAKPLTSSHWITENHWPHSNGEVVSGAQMMSCHQEKATYCTPGAGSDFISTHLRITLLMLFFS